MGLKEYQRKRNFRRTPEPKGKTKRTPGQLIFVIQQHAASRLHYDFRLELEGTLKSWAVPKGPSLNPNDKRLAVHVEDHPLDYATFEGTIPQGEYGGGTVMVWDQGTWEPEGDPGEDYKHGKLTFRLNGKKLHGIWSLVRMHGKASANGKNWLLIKKADTAASAKTNILKTKPLSAATKRSMIEIAAGAEIKTKPSKKITAILTGERKKPFPEIFQPQLAVLTTTPPQGENWLHELKFDGYRILCFLKNGKVKLITRNEKDWTDKYSTIAAAIKSFSKEPVILDGELVALDRKGKSNFQLLQNLQKTANPLAYYLFDIPYYNGYDLTQVPLAERKNLLKQLFGNWKNKNSRIRYSDYIIGQGETVFKKACEMGMEGIVSKKTDSFYHQKRTRDWLKIKCIQRQEFVIGGYTNPKGGRSYFGALLLGYYDNKGHFIYCGQVGTGFTEKSLKQIYQLLSAKTQKNSPFYDLASNKNTHWVKPVYVAQVEFAEWTQDNILREPSFQGLREDKDPRTIKQDKVKKAK